MENLVSYSAVAMRQRYAFSFSSMSNESNFLPIVYTFNCVYKIPKLKSCSSSVGILKFFYEQTFAYKSAEPMMLYMNVVSVSC